VISENYALQSPYLFAKSGVLPIFQFAPLDGGKEVLYTRLREDAEKVFEDAVELKESDFVVA
jgi:hypothetical protein